MLRYETYFKTFGLRRVTDIRKIMSYKAFDELPYGSTLHWLECLGNELSKETNPVADFTHFQKYIDGKRLMVFPETSHDTSGGVIQVDDTKIRSVRSKVLGKVRKIRSGDVRLVKQSSDLFSNNQVQGLAMYDPLFSADVGGFTPRVKIFNIVMSKLLTHVSNNMGNDHFVFIPVENIQFVPMDFAKSLKEYKRQNYRYPESYYYLFIMNLIGFLHGDSTDSLFEKVGENVLSRINFVLLNEDSDRSMHIRVDRLKAFTDRDPLIGKKILQVVNVVSKAVSKERLIGEAPESLMEVAATVGDNDTLNITGFEKPLPNDEIKKAARETVEEFQKIAITKIAESSELTPAQKKQAVKNYQAFKSIKIGEDTMEELINNNVPTLSVEDNDVSEYVDVPDKSVAKSTMATFSQDYMKTSFNADMSASLHSLSRLGMFVVDVKTEVVSDDLNDLTKYTVKFRDEKGESHTIKYRIPNVDEDGNCLVNGSLKRMSNQRINTPICKVSPTRVSISSQANKTIVERNASFSNSLIKQLKKYFNKTDLNIEPILGGNRYPEVTLPHDYVVIAGSYTGIKGLGINFTFVYDHRFGKRKQEDLLKKEKKLSAVFIGTFRGKDCFMDIDSVIHVEDDSKRRILNIIDDVLTDVNITQYNEWVNIILLNKKFPVIFLLAYRFGFENMLRYMRVDFDKIPKGSKTNADVTDIVIKTLDVVYVLKNPTTLQRFIFSGMNQFKLGELSHTDLDEKDAYFEILRSRGMSVEYLRGIDFLFDAFLDPRTIAILKQMGEPTNMRDLLIRATVLLTTGDHKEASSSSNFRIRSYEQMNAILYKSLVRALSTYQNKAVGHSNKFSISEFEVFTNIVTDPLFNNVDTVNPIATVKEQLHYTHIGDGGRTNDSMMISDRRYPQDGVGIMSEATVDSGKVGVDGILSTNPTVSNSFGLTISKDIEDISPSELLSPTSLLYPGATLDDAKRANFISIQMSQFIPVDGTNLARVRTGFEQVIPHRVGIPFAYVAKEDGKIVAINDEINMIYIEYKSGLQHAVEFGEIFSKNSSENFHVTQKCVINGFTVGNRVKKGDVVVYNESYFSPNPFSKQVDMGLGYFANVALLEGSKLLEDADYITPKLNKALTIRPTMTRSIQITKDTVLHKVATVGAKLKSTDALMVFDETDLGSMGGNANDETVTFLNALNKQIPKAKHSGKVVKIEVFYRCELSEMTDSLAKFVRTVIKEKNAKARFSANASNGNKYKPSKPLASDKIDGIFLDDETVYVKYYIQEENEMSSSDKVVFGAQLKSVCTSVSKEPPVTESGKVVDAVMGASSVANRMTPSIINQGAIETMMLKIEENVLEAYFG